MRVLRRRSRGPTGEGKGTEDKGEDTREGIEGTTDECSGEEGQGTREEGPWEWTSSVRDQSVFSALLTLSYLL